MAPPVYTIPKGPLTSKTLWFAGLTGIAAVVNALTDAVTDAQILTYLILAQAVVTAGLRWITSKPLDK